MEQTMEMTMVRLSTAKIAKFLHDGDHADSTTRQGRAFEDLICYIFEKIPGISVSLRDEFNATRTQEIDVAFWNEKKKNGLYFLPNLFIVECKNWSTSVRGQDIDWFFTKLKDRGRNFGILIARNGIIEDSPNPGANQVISNALRDGIEIIVFSGQDLENLRDTQQIIKLLKQKLCALAVSAKITI